MSLIFQKHGPLGPTRSMLRPAVVGLAVLAMGLLSSWGSSQSLSEFESRLHQFTLENGMTFLVLERHEAPVISFQTYADVGASDEVKGITGIAHLFEHMAFKGSETVGTLDYEAEKQAMEQMDQVFVQLKEARRRGEGDSPRVRELEERFRGLQEEVSRYMVSDEFEEALIREGGVGLNASTSADATRYVVNLPSNKIELWMALESERFLHPVLREFYKEKDVVMEERRSRTEVSPQGRLVEDMLATAYKAHPYGEPVVGHMSDLETLTRAEASEFFQRYYAPSNLTVAMAGDVDPQQVQSLARLYFGRIPARPKPPPVETVEPPQWGERRVTVESPSQPALYIAYHKPDINHPDDAALEAVADILGTGRTSRLYKRLVKDQKIAVGAYAFQGFPGNKYPGLFVLAATPARGHSSEECEAALSEEIERLKTEPVSGTELDKFKKRSRAGLLRDLRSNRGLASQLAFFQVVTGDWRNLFRQLERIDEVTVEDIQRVAAKYFVGNRRTVAVLETQSAGD